MLPDATQYDALIVGGGFFGMYIGEYLALNGKRVLVCEMSDHCMGRASYHNQARVHSGYHYPRSVLTAMRSCVSFPRFVAEFPDCVKQDFAKYYAIGKILGKVSARQFHNFCMRIGAPCESAPGKVTRLFDPHFIEEVFSVREFAFDAAKLREAMLKRLRAAGVELRYDARVQTVRRDEAGLAAVIASGDDKREIEVGEIFNCCYSHLNFLNANSGLELIPLKHEMTEMALVEPPQELASCGITVMCGPFFSIMPFPDRNMHSFSHVRYTPHYEWHERSGLPYRSAYDIFAADPKKTDYAAMITDAARYLPIIRGSKYRESLWEVKTVLPASEVDDSRPILFKTDYCLPGYHCVMGGKIDNVYDVISAIDRMHATNNLEK